MKIFKSILKSNWNIFLWGLLEYCNLGFWYVSSFSTSVIVIPWLFQKHFRNHNCHVQIVPYIFLWHRVYKVCDICDIWLYLLDTCAIILRVFLEVFICVMVSFLLHINMKEWFIIIKNAWLCLINRVFSF